MDAQRPPDNPDINDIQDNTDIHGTQDDTGTPDSQDDTGIFIEATGQPLTASEVPVKKHLKFEHRILWLALFTAILIIALLFGLVHYYNLKKASQKQKKVPVPVSLAKAARQNVPLYLVALGSVIPRNTITVKTQINGQLLRVLFEEGQMVKAGDLLAEIDPRPYQAQQIQYEGQLARDRALLANAKIDLQRYKTLYTQDAVSQQTLATQISLVEQYEGNVKFDLGQLETIRVNLIYCKITSPVDGRVGLRLVDPGNFVQVSDPNGIVVLNTIHPITVVFSIPEDNLPAVAQEIAAGHTLVTEAYDRTQNTLLATGTLLTVDNQIDPSTGTVKIKSIFKNENNALFPNQFVNVQLRVNTIPNATVIPTAAIQRGTKGSFVYRVNNDNTVSLIPVTIQTTLKDQTAIKGDILPNQSVVIEGADKLTNGSTVTVPTVTKKENQVTKQ